MDTYMPDSAWYNTKETSTEKLRDRARSQGVTSKILLTTLALVIVICTLLATLIVYIFVLHQASIDGSTTIVTTAQLSIILTISQVISHVAGTAVAVVMSIQSYRWAALWIDASRSHSINRPTPQQRGILMNAIRGSNVMVLKDILFYNFRFGSEARRQVAIRPPLLRSVAFYLLKFLALYYIIAGVDTWFHVSSNGAIITKTIPYPSNLSSSFSRSLNQIACSSAQSTYANSSVANLCGLENSSPSNTFLISAGPALITLSNGSAVNIIVFTNDNTAIIAPAYIPDNITYTATTRGVKSQCQSITTQCVDPNVDSPEALVNFRCPPPYANLTSETEGNVFLPNGTILAPSGVGTPNPFMVGSAVSSLAYVSSDDTYVGETGFYSHGHTSWNVVACQVLVLDVVYRYTEPSTFTIITTTLADLNNTGITATMIDSGYPNTYAPMRVEGMGLGTNSASSYTDAYALEFSRDLLAMSAPVYEADNALEAESRFAVVGSRLQIIPFALLLSMIMVFVILIVFAGVSSIIASRRKPWVRLARAQLSDPLTAVQALHGPFDANRGWEEDVQRLFANESELDRLSVGPMPMRDGQVVYGVFRE